LNNSFNVPLSAQKRGELDYMLSSNTINSSDALNDGNSREGLETIEPGTEWEQLNMNDDQNQNVFRAIETGDMIVELINCARLTGLELCGMLHFHFSISDLQRSHHRGSVCDRQR
jgi:hypothetical protein